jgi:CRP-like cAMP-binding protein
VLAASLLLHVVASDRVRPVRGQPEAALDLSDGRRLERAFGWIVATLLAECRHAGGSRPARALAQRFNAYALAAGWPLAVAQGELDGRAPAALSLIERGATYASALGLLLDLVAGEVGEALTVRALQRAYDGLPWEEREIAGQYMLRDVKRAEALSREFDAAARDHRALLRRMPLFATMDETEIGLLRARLHEVHYAAGRTIIHQGDLGDRFYIIDRGHVEVTVRDETGASRVVNQLDRGDYFGELALLRDAPRNATCRATVPTDLLALSRQDFDQLVRARFGLREKLDQSLARAELLRRIPLFGELDSQQVKWIAAQLHEQVLDTGTVLIRQGERGHSFYLIESGQLAVSTRQDGEELVFAQRGPGEYVGEIALLLDVPRTATVTAVSDTRVLTLDRAAFGHLVAEELAIGRGLERETSRRMRDLQRSLSPT